MARPVIPIAVAAPNTASHASSVFLAPPPLTLYIHMPWCVRKCPYCDFNSHEARQDIPETAYIDALIADLEAALPSVWGRPVHAVFIGGGTPSLFAPDAYDALLAAVRARLPLQPDAEVTLEANPGTVEAARFAGYRAAGINRVSLGIQSFEDAKLKALGRIHDGDEARRAIEVAQRHFDRVNLDLMIALPGQTLEQARRDVETAIAWGTEHLSAYHLTLEPNTPFHRDPPPLPDDDLSADIAEMAESHLAAAGYVHYETSAHARPGAQCRHNLNYWQFGDYLGIGAGAHGKITSHEGVVREMRRKHPRDYLAGAARRDFIQQRHRVETAELPGEFMMNALRLNEGFHPHLFEERTGLPWSTVQAALRVAQREGLLEVGPDAVVPTRHGRRFLNRLLAGFL